MTLELSREPEAYLISASQFMRDALVVIRYINPGPYTAGVNYSYLTPDQIMALSSELACIIHNIPETLVGRMPERTRRTRVNYEFRSALARMRDNEAAFDLANALPDETMRTWTRMIKTAEQILFEARTPSNPERPKNAQSP